MRQANIKLLTAAVATLMACASCVSDDTDFSDIIGATPSYTLRDISFDYTPLTEEETVPSDDNDYYENATLKRTVYITFSQDTATIETSAKGITSTVRGAHVTICATKSGFHYVLTGQTTDGGLKIYSEKKFMLTLSGVDISNPNGAAINNQCGKRMYLHLADGTTNQLADGTSYTTTEGEDEKGALFSEGQIIVSGSGALTVLGNGKNGIATDDYLVLRPGTVVNVTANQKACLKANDGIFIRGGVLNLESTADGGKALNSEASISISGGRLTAIASGSTLVSGTDTTGVACLKADSTFTLTAGQVLLKTTGDGGKGLHAKTGFSITGGSLLIEAFGTSSLAQAKGIKTSSVASFLGGSSYIYSKSSAPIDADGGINMGEALTATYTDDGRLVEIE